MTPGATDRPGGTESLPAVKLERVSGGYGGALVLSDVSLEIARGEFVGLVGPSGAGKTTLLRAMLGLLPGARGAVTLNQRLVTPGATLHGVGYVPQSETVDWSFPVTVDNVILMGRGNRGNRFPWPSRADRTAVNRLLDQLGLTGLGGRHIRELSGGQRQRVFLARALAAEPDILVLDEPTASVDVNTRDDILRLLVQLNRQGVTVVMTTHELNAVAAQLPWLVCVNRGIVAAGPPARVFTEPILSRTFDAPMRVVPDPLSGAPVIAERSGFADLLRAEPGNLAAREPLLSPASHHGNR